MADSGGDFAEHSLSPATRTFGEEACSRWRAKPFQGVGLLRSPTGINPLAIASSLATKAKLAPDV